ncbi:MAG: T9SS type A sorting domain-containing protein [Bacteroidota bacterium]
MKKFNSFLAAVVFSLAVNAQNTITTDTILQLSTCAGGNVIVPFSTTGTFPVGTLFTAQLSDIFGQFTTPINIGNIPFNAGLIFATIPANTNFGFLYKIRVVTNSPAVIGSPCPNTLIITQVAQLNQIIATPNDTICQGETVTLSALNPAGSYMWSTGDTTQAITVSQAGNYSVTVTDFLMCETDTSINITVLPQPCSLGKDELEKISIEIYPNPTTGKFQIEVSNSDLSAIDFIIYNSVGQQIQVGYNELNSNTVEFDLSSKDAGIYMLKINLFNKIITKCIVKN